MTHPFARDNEVNEPGIIGARWWNGAVHEASGATGRRTALGCITASIIGVAALTVIPVIAVVAGDCGGDDDEKEEARASLKLQQDFGWNFDVPTQTVTFSPSEIKEYTRAALATLVEDLTPKRADLAPYAVHTLFQSPEALPTLKLADGSNANIKPIAEVLRPIFSPTMALAFARGQAFGPLLAGSSEPVAVVADLEGPDAVAFAAGASSTHEPVFLFDNWPHPFGVVKSHLALAAAVYYQSIFRETKAKRGALSPPLFVLDRTRLAKYVDGPTEFDNRYVAKLPAVGQLVTNLGLKRVLLVVSETPPGPPEQPDTRSALAAYAQVNAEVRALAIESFITDREGHPYYGGTAASQAEFLDQYGWRGTASPRPATSHAPQFLLTKWRPPSETAPDPSLTTLGVTTVAVALGTGYVLRRSGTWNRASSWGGG